MKEEKTNKNLNIYQKIQKIKKELSEMKLKKTGVNKFSNYTYYELKDFVPELIKLCDKYEIFTKFNFEKTMVTLKVINCENLEEVVEYSSPIEELEIKGANKIQSLGGIQTYLRRYLYMNAFDIVEDDYFDKENTEIIKKEDPKEKLILLGEYKKLVNATKTDSEEIYKYFKIKNDTEFTNETLKQAIEILKKKTIIKNNEEVF